jgi:hypothetical protein
MQAQTQARLLTKLFLKPFCKAKSLGKMLCKAFLQGKKPWENASQKEKFNQKKILLRKINTFFYFPLFPALEFLQNSFLCRQT